jgi:hypothetical protein
MKLKLSLIYTRRHSIRELSGPYSGNYRAVQWEWGIGKGAWARELDRIYEKAYRDRWDGSAGVFTIKRRWFLIGARYIVCYRGYRSVAIALSEATV